MASVPVADIQARRAIEAAAWAFADGTSPPPPFGDEMTLEEIVTAAVHPSPQWRRVAARRKDCPTELLVELASDTDRQVRRDVAHNPRLPPDSRVVVLRAAQQDGDQSTLSVLASNPSMTTDELRALLGPVSLFEKARKNTLPPNIGWVVMRADCPPEYFEPISRTYMMSQYLAAAAHCPPDLLVRWAMRSSYPTGAIAAANVHCPPFAIAEASRRSDDLPASYAANNPNLPDKAVAAAATRFPRSLAAARYTTRPTLTVDEQVRFVAEGDTRIRLTVAGNPATDPSVLDSLATRCATPALLARIAANPNVSDAALARLASHGKAKVKHAAARTLASRS